MKKPCSYGREGADRIRTGVCDRNTDIGVLPRRFRYGHAWQKTRARILDVRGYACEWCGSAERLEVHHLTYERFGAELDEDLLVLCAACHLAEHNRERTTARLAEEQAAWDALDVTGSEAAA